MSRLEHFGKDIPLEKLGVDVVSPWEERHYRKFHEETRHPKTTVDVPLSRIRAGQSTVDLDPSYRRDPTKDASEPIRGQSLPDGRIQLEDGHHRLVQAKLAGATSLPVQHLGRGSGKCLLPYCEYGHETAPR